MPATTCGAERKLASSASRAFPAGGTLFGAGAGHAAGQGRPALQLLPEDGGVGLPEAVDALLEVTHEEEVVPCRACEAAVKGILQGVGVLIFVHHDGSIALSDALAQLGGLAVLVPQEAKGQMLEVAEFQQPALPLPGRKAGVEVPHGGKKGRAGGVRRLSGPARPRPDYS